MLAGSGSLVICVYACVIIENRKMSSLLKELKSPNSNYDKVELKPHSKSTSKAPYEECGGGVTSSNVAMEENPAHQSVDVAAVSTN